jgi:hypothetical protein
MFVGKNTHLYIYFLFHDVFKANIYNHQLSGSDQFFIQIIIILFLAGESKEKKLSMFIALFTHSLHDRLISGHEIIEKSMQRI